MSDLDSFRDQQEKEYGTYVAKETIFIRGARAFNAGDPVPVSHVERGVVPEDAVVKRNTKAGQAAIEESAPTTSKKG